MILYFSQEYLIKKKEGQNQRIKDEWQCGRQQQMIFSNQRMRNYQQKGCRKQEDEAKLHLKLQLLFYKLKNKPMNTQSMAQNKSWSKFSKVTFRAPHQESNELRHIKSIKQHIEYCLQEEIKTLKQQYSLLVEKQQQQIHKRQSKIRQNKQNIQNIEHMLRSIKSITNDINLKAKPFKTNSLLKMKQRIKNYVQKTPIRHTLNPFQRDNSLLMSVKRSMIDEMNGNNSIKNSDKQLLISNDFRWSQIQSNPMQNPFLSTLQNKGKPTIFNDFIKETQEDQHNESFEVVSSKIRFQFKEYSQREGQNGQKHQRIIAQKQIIASKLLQQIEKEKKQSQVQWRTIQAQFRVQAISIRRLLEQEANNRKALSLDRQQIFNLLQQQFQNALAQQKSIRKREHVSLLSTLSRVMQRWA